MEEVEEREEAQQAAIPVPAAAAAAVKAVMALTLSQREVTQILQPWLVATEVRAVRVVAPVAPQ